MMAAIHSELAEHDSHNTYLRLKDEKIDELVFSNRHKNIFVEVGLILFVFFLCKSGGVSPALLTVSD